MYKFLILFAAVLQCVSPWFYGRPDPGASSQGGVWPLPLNFTTYDGTAPLTIDPGSFKFLYNSNCDIIDKAVKRYTKWMFPNPSTKLVGKADLIMVHISFTGKCDSSYPQADMDESYTISVTPGSSAALISANEVWGALRALESFSQLVYLGLNNTYVVRCASIYDKPRFGYRGAMLDTSRHWVSINVLKKMLDLMSMNKMNVFHWHLVDSESFPYVSTKFPDLSRLGAYSEKHIYSPSDVQSVISHARLRGIRVVPEFDTPGHTGAWWGQSNLLSKCYDHTGANNILANIIDPTKPENLQFVKDFFAEALTVFKDNSMHFGGDETSSYMLECWARNPDVTAWMQANGMGTDTSQLLNYFFKSLVKSVQDSRKGTQMIFWQEVLDMGVAPPNSIAHVWKGDNMDEIMNEMATVTGNGHQAILSSCWYLSFIKYGAVWDSVTGDNMRSTGMYYQCDPTNFKGTQAQKDLVLGGVAALWSEFVDGTNMVQNFFPRASAVAERLWSEAKQTQDPDAAWPRLHEHRCRMMNRGYEVQPPNNPDYCPNEWQPAYVDVDI
uniref:Beta-hexosaminidase n=1 Tax=Rhabditophanes sp. KR3021 TaxID=114890 RepID=A0AC35TNY4_9BILA